MRSRELRILVLNGGSSSIKFSVFVSGDDAVTDLPLVVAWEGQLTGIGGGAATLKISGAGGAGIGDRERGVKAETLQQAVSLVLETVSGQSALSIDAIGYRVVHPGSKLWGHQRITPEVLQLLEEANEFAPLHDPEAVMLIRATMQHYPDAAHYACFDTAFHRTMPAEAQTYPLPGIYRDSGVHRYGFHGLSCESIVRRMKTAGTLPPRMVIAHLGSGCSVTALQDGRSVDTTMGLTPTGGVLMGTRSGDLDPGLVLYLMRKQTGSRDEAAAAVETLLNHSSGMSVLSGLANDMRMLREAAANGNEEALLALKVFTRSITKAVGGFCWLLGGLDAIVFTGGIGEHDAETRREVLAGISEMGVELDEDTSSVVREVGMQRISSGTSRTAAYVAPAQEDWMIAIHVTQMAMADGIGTHTKERLHQEKAL
jgi:acetate kinase